MHKTMVQDVLQLRELQEKDVCPEQNITVFACDGKGREMLMGVYRHT